VKSVPRGSFQDRDWQSGRSFRVRPASSLDQAPMCRLLVSAYREYQWCLTPNAYMMYITDLVDLEPRVRAGRTLVADRGGQLLGTVTCGREEPDLVTGPGVAWPAGFAVVHGFAVRRDVRRLGVGAALIEEAMTRARREGARALGLHIAPFMTSAVALAERFGCLRAPAFDFDPGQAEDPLVGQRLPLLAYVLLLR
jgi:GNAT superfamily N-acetyltransferase